ncbi:hypothetical protein GCM10027347_17350 [Larkinella harenae]
MEMPCIIRFKSEPIDLKSANEFLYKKNTSKKIRELAKYALLIENTNKRRDDDNLFNIEPVLAELSKPTILKQSGFDTLKWIKTGGKISIETEKLIPGGKLYRAGEGIGSRVQIVQVSKPYLVVEHWEAEHTFFFKIASISRLDAFLKHQKVAFHEISFKSWDASVYDVQPLTAPDVDGLSQQ